MAGVDSHKLSSICANCQSCLQVCRCGYNLHWEAPRVHLDDVSPAANLIDLATCYNLNTLMAQQCNPTIHLSILPPLFPALPGNIISIGPTQLPCV